jgi:hypothetical protein
MEDWRMKIHWGRVLNAGLVAEILLVGIYQIVAWRYGGPSQAGNIFVGLGSFVFLV